MSAGRTLRAHRWSSDRAASYVQLVGSDWCVPNLSNAGTPVTEGGVGAMLRCESRRYRLLRRGGGAHGLCGLG